MYQPFYIAVAGLDPAIHVFLFESPRMKTWTPGSSPGEAKFIATLLTVRPGSVA